MAHPPSLIGEPKISQKGSTVHMEALVACHAAPAVKWSREEKELKPGPEYKMSCDKDGANFKVCCEIVNFDKTFAGVYKADICGTFATFNVTTGDVPDFYDKPHIVQKEGGKVLGIKIRAKSKTPVTAEWFKNESPVKHTDRVKAVQKKNDKDAGEFIFLLEITSPVKEDQAKYKCVVKNKDGTNSQSLNLNFD